VAEAERSLVLRQAAESRDANDPFDVIQRVDGVGELLGGLRWQYRERSTAAKRSNGWRTSRKISRSSAIQHVGVSSR